ncbi:hypothetical protein CFK37_04235 [Virgibacillus phasianinus]|uniref:GNAT family N-acetyltransferase n=1 Tax=Virgibacillus phasianinus TaxID=2017483 RepID=A0A220U001_9BACI|nr:hypothetical protein [Virgibacillus phasianinus]ASK61438.1 hypothetical protein CFK37_04235 [Virgibacillus phasianinus]
MIGTAFLEDNKSKDEIKEELDTIEIQLFRMQQNIKEIAKKWQIVSIDQTKDNGWVVIYADKGEEACQIMLHDCDAAFRGDWHAAIQADYKDGNTIHIADIKGEQNKGYGSILMCHLKEMARLENVQYITGDIVERDFDHVNRLEHFYSKHRFDVKIDHDEQCGEIIWNED